MSTDLNSLFDIKHFILRSQYIVLIIDHNNLISDIDNLNVNNEFSFFDSFEQSSYEFTRQDQIIQRRFRKSIFIYQQQTMKNTIKSRVFFDVSQFLQLDPKITNNDKVSFIL